jgi:regulator of sigma E protease
MNILVAILILGIIIIIHELGHFLLAKKNGITVTEFSVGMGPRIASFVRNGTRYSLKALPFGGSCMMLGEDETIEDEGAFHKKGVWARFSVIFAGAFFNFVLAFVLALIVLGAEGVDLPKITEIKTGSPIDQAGLMPDDWITDINGSSIHFDRELGYYFYFNELTDKPVRITYERDGVSNKVDVTPVMVNTYRMGFAYSTETEAADVTEITPEDAIALAGLKVGDIIVGIDGTKISSDRELSAYLEKNPLTEKEITLTYLRDGKEATATVAPKLFNSGYELGWYFDFEAEKVSALNVIKYSVYELKYNIVNTIKGVWYLISGKVNVNEMMGPVGIVRYVGDVVNETKDSGIGVTLLSLAKFCILISANLGVMNLLPIPALDGGRLVFIIIEAIRRKPVPREKEAMVHLVGMALLMILMVLVLFNDIRNIFQ